MKVKVMNRFLKLITANDVIAITLAPFGIYVRKKDILEDDQTMRHEMIHWKQQVEMLVIPFYLWYIIEWLLKMIKYGDAAYYQISFEQEAYGYQFDPKYLITRKHYSWIKYITKKRKNE